MSTIMAFSARSFGDAASAGCRRRSSWLLRPRGEVPFIGRAVSTSPSRRKNSSGEAEQMTCRPVSRIGPVAGGLGRREATKKPPRIALERGPQTEGEIHLVGVSAGDVILDAVDGLVVLGGCNRCLPGPDGKVAGLQRGRAVLPVQFAEEAEPQKRQRAAGMGAAGLVHGRGRFVAEEPRGMEPAPDGLIHGRELGKDFGRLLGLQHADQATADQQDRRRGIAILAEEQRVREFPSCLCRNQGLEPGHCPFPAPVSPGREPGDDVNATRRDGYPSAIPGLTPGAQKIHGLR